MPRPRDREGFRLVVVCALPLERNAVEAVMEVDYKDDGGPSYGKQDGDLNTYALGELGGQPIVLVCLADTGTRGATEVVRMLQFSFRNIMLAFLVGITGGAPFKADGSQSGVRLGDIIVSDAMLEYDSGKQNENHFATNTEFKKRLSKAAEIVTRYVQSVDGSKAHKRLTTKTNIDFDQYDDLNTDDYKSPGRVQDHIYARDYRHKHQNSGRCNVCANCLEWNHNVCETALESSCEELGCEPMACPLGQDRETSKVFFGPYVSGSGVMKSARRRDELVQQFGALGIEMEGAGVWGTFPTMVVKGVVDYADSHKNKTWRKYPAARAALCTKAIIEDMDFSQMPRIGPIPHSTVPFSKDPNFVGREDILLKIRAIFSQHNHHHRVALTGLGGIGKSQIAIEFSNRYRAKYSEHWVFWIHASTTDRFIQAYQDIARVVEAPGYQDSKSDLPQLVRNWLTDARNGYWLIIIDNADDPSVFTPLEDMRARNGGQEGSRSLRSYIPQSSHGAVLVTSRNDTGVDLVGSTGVVVKVGEFDEKTAVQLLRSKLPEILVDENSTKLLQLLDYIPLAIVQASASIQKARTTISQYLSAYVNSEDRQRQFLSRGWADIRRDPDVPNAVITSWKISFDQIERTSAAAVKVFSLMSMFDRQGIPEYLIALDGLEAFDISEAIGLLLEYSFILQEGDKRFYSMHRLVQLAMKIRLEDNQELAQWKQRSISVLKRQFPDGSIATWPTCQILLPHAQKVLGYIQHSGRVFGNLELLHNVGSYHREQGSYDNAALMHNRVLSGYEEQLGPTHPDTLRTVQNLAIVYQSQGRYGEAETLYGRALKGNEEQLGPTHPDTLRTVQNLAIVYRLQGRYGEAETLYGRALKGREEQLGPMHPDTLRTVQNLAIVYDLQGRYGEAETLYGRALKGYEEQLGPTHPDTLRTVQNLAIVYQSQGRHGEAETLYGRALKGYEEQLGPTHPNTLRTVQNLAIVYQSQGRYGEAETLYGRALKGREEQLGPTHPDTLRTVQNLAIVYQSQGRYGEAETLYGRALKGREEQLGPTHPDTLRTVQNLAIVYDLQGRYGEAETLYGRALKGREEQLGPTHPNTLSTVQNLAIVYQSQGRHGEAETLYGRALKGYEEQLGPTHPDTLGTVQNLAIVYQSQGRYGEAETLYGRALKGREEQLGPTHPDTLRTVQNLGKHYADLARNAHVQGIQRRLQRAPPANISRYGTTECLLAKLIFLCQRFPYSTILLLDVVGRTLLRVGDDKNACAAFQQQMVRFKDTWSHGNTVCDYCDRSLTVETERLVCKTCADVDLCEACYCVYEVLDTTNKAMASCAGHDFLAVPKLDSFQRDQGKAQKLWISKMLQVYPLGTNGSA